MSGTMHDPSRWGASDQIGAGKPAISFLAEEPRRDWAG